MNKIYSDFLKMKEFFTLRQREYAFYRVKPLSYRDAYSDYCSIDRFRDGFAIEFDWRADGDAELYGIESYDSFAFSIYCVYYGDRIELTDLNRTWECGVEAYEGTGLASTYFEQMEAFINRHGYSLSDKPRQSTIIKKVTTIDSFARDAIELVSVMLTINCIDEEPPYLHEDNRRILWDIQALEESWLTKTQKRPTAISSTAVIDLTQTITEDMPVFPGDPAPALVKVGDYGKREPRLTNISMCSHTGTHIDAPAHFFEGARTITDFPPDYFIGKALVIDCRQIKDGENITKELILSYGDRLDGMDFLLFCTGWDKKWGTEDYFKGYPTLDTRGAMLICKSGFRGIGFDTPSVDSPSDERCSRHCQILSDNNLFIIENLKNLELLGDGAVRLIALPLKISEADGSPARAIAIKEQ